MKQGWLLAMVCLMSGGAWAHESVSPVKNSAEKIELKTAKHTLKLNAEGQLFFDVHRIGLSEAQQSLMAQYHQTVMQQKFLKSQIQASIPALSSWEGNADSIKSPVDLEAFLRQP